jgi:hypothetical protein
MQDQPSSLTDAEADEDEQERQALIPLVSQLDDALYRLPDGSPWVDGLLAARAHLVAFLERL